MRCDDLMIERCHELLVHDFGNLIWRVDRKGGARAGDIAGGLDAKGYRVIRIDGKQYKAHRLVWLLTYGRWPTASLDHIDRNPTNNRIENLREATNAENQQNSGLRKNSTSGLTGSSWDSSRQKWQAHIRKDRKTIKLGRFNSKEKAYAAYCQAKRELHTFNPERCHGDHLAHLANEQDGLL